MKITIYCLINPLTNEPFYVGATVNPLQVRLSEHLFSSTCHGGFQQQRHDMMARIMKKKMRPVIFPLVVTTEKRVDYYEEYYYKRYTRMGFKLLQRNDKFSYSKDKKKTIDRHNKMYETFYNIVNSRIG
jgi:hypothetical protein